MDYGIAAGLNLSKPAQLVTKGAIMRGVFADQTSPLAYGYSGKELPVYFSEAPVLTVSRSSGGMGSFAPNASGANIYQNITPNASSMPVSPWPADAAPKTDSTAKSDADVESAPPVSRTGGAEPTQFPRVVMEFPAKADDILLSGLLHGGQALTRKPLLVDVPDGKGHMVLYALRPFWRWQTQGSYFLGFNAILNWDHLDAGKKPADDKSASGKPAAE